MLRHAVDPAPAQAHVDRLFGRDRLQARPHSVDPDPDLVFLVVVRAEPLVEGDAALECLDLGGIDFDRRHHASFRRAMDPVFIEAIIIVYPPDGRLYAKSKQRAGAANARDRGGRGSQALLALR